MTSSWVPIDNKCTQWPPIDTSMVGTMAGTQAGARANDDEDLEPERDAVCNNMFT